MTFNDILKEEERIVSESAYRRSVETMLEENSIGNDCTDEERQQMLSDYYKSIVSKLAENEDRKKIARKAKHYKDVGFYEEINARLRIKKQQIENEMRKKIK